MSITEANSRNSYEEREYLLYLCKDVTSSNLAQLKYCLIAESKVREDIETFIELMEVMRQRHPENYLERLAKALKAISREDLRKSVGEYINTKDGKRLVLGYRDVGAKFDLDVDRASVRFPLHGVDFNLADTSKNNYVGKLTDMVVNKNAAENIEEIKLRKYQIELAQPALEGKNCIICAPTGSGKTLTVGYICKELIKRKPKIQIIFLVHIRSLAKQQAEMLSQMLDGKVFNNSESLPLLYIWKEHNVIVSTHQVLLNELVMKSMHISDPDLIIFDECHHTKLDHPYNKIMLHYYNHLQEDPGKKFPQIIGLTASLGTNNSIKKDEIIKHFIDLCTRLNSTIKIVENPRNLEELMLFNPEPTDQQFICCKPHQGGPLFQKLADIMFEIENGLEIGIELTTPKGSQRYQNEIIKMREMYAEEKDTLEKITACEALQAINDALLLLSDLTEEYALQFLERKIILLNFEHEKLKEFYNVLIKSIQELKDTFLDQKDAWKSNEKLVRLCDLLEKLCEEDASGIILTQTCINVDYLVVFLKNQSRLSKKFQVFKLVGQTNAEYGMTENEQINSISTFKKRKEDKCHVLVATDIAQEGIDLPKTNFVIRYNFVSNEIGTTQSKGRARAPNSKIYLIVEEGSSNLVQERCNMLKEREMKAALQDLNKEETKFESRLEIAKGNYLKSVTLEIQLRNRSKRADPSTISFYCKKCKNRICYANEIRKYFTNYVCVNPHIEDITTFERWEITRTFAHDTHLGDLFCANPECKSNLATKIKSVKFIGLYLYILKKKSLSFKEEQSGKYVTPKKWEGLPFEIEALNQFLGS